jgi:hypothetical protein
MPTTPSTFDTRNDPPKGEPIVIAAAVFIVGIMLILALLVAAS